MKLITEEDQNNIYNLYQEGILNRARAGLGSFIGGGGVEGKLNNIISQYKTKIGRELGDLQADLKTFKGSLQPEQGQRLNQLLGNLNAVGIKEAQTILDKFGHMIGRVVGAAAPAAAVGMATAGLGAAPVLAGAAAGFTRGLRNAPRTDIGTGSKLGKIGISTGLGAAIGYGSGKLNDWLQGGSGGGPPASPEAIASSPQVGPSGGDSLDIFKALHNSNFDPKSPVDAAKMALQELGQQKGLAGNKLAEFVYNNGGTEEMNGRIARELLNKLGTTRQEIADSVIGSSTTAGSAPAASYDTSSFIRDPRGLGDLRDLAAEVTPSSLPAVETTTSNLTELMGQLSPEQYQAVIPKIEAIFNNPAFSQEKAERLSEILINRAINRDYSSDIINATDSVSNVLSRR